MKFKDVAAAFGVLFAGAINSPAASLSVAGDANIFGAGHPSVRPGGGQGQLPPFFSFAPGMFSTLTFTGVTGMVTLDSFALNNPDGRGAPPVSSSTTSLDGISGIIAPRAGYLVGVFLTDAEPADPAPPILDFTSLGTAFTTFSPLINQTFFVGDGLTGDGFGMQQQFIVPATATRLFLGITDALGYQGSPGTYNDNGGSFTANFALIPEPSVIALQIAGLIAFLFHRIRRIEKR